MSWYRSIGFGFVAAWLSLSPCRAAEVDDFLAQLGAERFADRESAQQQLIELGEGEDAGESVIRPAAAMYAANTDPEVQHRLRQVLRALFEKHYLDRPRGFLGIRFSRDMPAVAGGEPTVTVMSVTDGSGAEAAGLQPGDRLVKIDDLDLLKPRAGDRFAPFIQSKRPGETLDLVIQRGDERLELPVTLGELPRQEVQRLHTPAQRQRLFEGWLSEQVEPAR